MADPAIRLTEADRDIFVTCLRDVERCCSIRVIAYSVTLKDFEVFLEIPPANPTIDTAEALLDRLKRSLVGAGKVANIERRLAKFRSADDVEGEREYVAGTYRRLRNEDRFIKLLVEQFTSSYNQTRNRTGKVWAEPGWWTPVEDSGETTLAMATYIDLNGVRAGLAKKYEEYRWCSFGEAMRGMEPAGAAIQFVIHRYFDRDESLAKALVTYREQLVQRHAGLNRLALAG